jgi:hypothetical protein
VNFLWYLFIFNIKPLDVGLLPPSSVIYCSQDHPRNGTHDLDHPVLAGAKNIDSWHASTGDLQRAFSLDILMVPLLVLAITVDGERLSHSGFSLSETIHFGRLKFIADYFGSLSLSPQRDGSNVTAMGSTSSGPPSPLRDMSGDSTEVFHTASDEEGGGGAQPPLS